MCIPHVVNAPVLFLLLLFSFASCLFTVSVCYPSSNELKHCMRNMEGGIAGHLCFGFFVTEFSPQFSPPLNNSSLRFYMSGTNVTKLFDRRLPALQSWAPGFSPPTPGLDLPSPGPGKPTVASHSVVSLYVHFPNIIRYQNQLLQEHSSLTPLVISPLVYGFLIIISFIYSKSFNWLCVSLSLGDTKVPPSNLNSNRK